jgi:Family of unknown function (DUF5519)
MSTTQTVAQSIIEKVTSWPGVTTAPGRFGAQSLILGRREIGHLHGEHVAHFAFPRSVCSDLLAAGRVTPHPVAPDAPGLAARRISGDDDIADVIALMRLNYDRIVARYGLPGRSRGFSSPTPSA